MVMGIEPGLGQQQPNILQGLRGLLGQGLLGQGAGRGLLGQGFLGPSDELGQELGLGLEQGLLQSFGQEPAQVLVGQGRGGRGQEPEFELGLELGTGVLARPRSALGGDAHSRGCTTPAAQLIAVRVSSSNKRGLFVPGVCTARARLPH